MAKIKVEHLKYKYPSATKLALDDVSFEVDQGEFIGVIGRNLSGKSTLCQALVGLVPHFYHGGYGGKVIVDGSEVKQSTISELALKVGIVFQNPFTQVTGSKLTVYEEIAFGLENMGLKRREMIERIDYAMSALKIEPYKDRHPFELSGGQMQRMAIASMFAMKPQVMVLDEPTSQLDPQGSEEVFQAVQALTREGIIIVMAEHKLERMAQFADKVLLLDDGKRVAFDTPAAVFSREDLREHGMTAPVYTRVCRALNLKEAGSPYYPVTLDAACEVLKK